MSSKQVMFVGIAPTKQDIMRGKPFSGVAGQMLMCILKSLNINIDDCHFTNVLDKPVSGAEPEPEDIIERIQPLWAEIRSINPKLVVTLGKLPGELLQRAQLKKIRGNIAHFDNRYWLATYNPAAVLYGSYTLVNDIVRDLNKIKLILGMPNDGPQTEPLWTLVQSRSDFQKILDGLPVQPTPIIIDIETTNPAEEIDTFVDKLLCIGIGYDDHCYVVPAEYCTDCIWPLNRRYVFHNGIFDSQGILRYLGVKLPICEDTMLISYCLDERAGKHGLKGLSREYIGAGHYEELKQGYEQGEELWAYNAKDVVYTQALFNILKPMQVEDQTEWYYDNLLIPASNAFVDIQSRGVFINMDVSRQLTRDWLPKSRDMQRKLVENAKLYGFPGDINTSSPKQLSHLLYDLIGLKGGPSTRRDVLETLDHPYLTQLLDWRQVDHMIRCYLIGIQDDLKRDRRVHAHVLLHATTSGRLAYKNPPLQTIPTKGKVGEDLARIRNIFTATNDDYCIVEADYSKAEVWGAYSVSRDRQLYADLCAADFHKTIAAAVFRKSYDDVTKDERQSAKAVTFGGSINYAKLKPSQLLEA